MREVKQRLREETERIIKEKRGRLLVFSGSQHGFHVVAASHESVTPCPAPADAENGPWRLYRVHQMYRDSMDGHGLQQDILHGRRLRSFWS